jgi:beta-lactamase regulating signal transducer with metallopeptidase domain
MPVLIAIALKSLLIAGLTLGLLTVMKRRSAAERSWVAHIGLLALVIMALAPLVLPSWNVEAPALLGRTSTVEAAAADSPPMTAVASVPVAARPLPDIKVPARPSLSPTAAAMALYAVPAAILLFITALALARLIALRARADVLVDGHWLSALARAQRRMGFKHGTALLTSNELSSPISWGLMRPVILLNNRAVEASGEAEAIIAHELAHVARMDWIKLLLARVATAMFWFNPFVWLLAREAHQLREEAADDAVLAADIEDTDYAQLLVGVARHECPGLLLGAHGVAPSRNSLARRVARVLDGKSVRGPAARSFALGVFTGAVLIAAPLAALTLTPGGTSKKASANAAGPIDVSKPYYAASEPPADLPHIIASGVSTSVATVAAAVASQKAETARSAREQSVAAALAAADQAREQALADATKATKQAREAAKVSVMSNGHIDKIIEMKAAGVDAGYVYALRVAQPKLRDMDPASFAGMKSIGVTPDYARELAAAGLRNLNADQLTEARAVGLTGAYVRGLAAAGIPLSLDDYVQLHTVGVPMNYISEIRKSGYSVADPDKIIQMWAIGVRGRDLKAVQPPHVPRPPMPPPNVEVPDNPDGG